MAVVARQGSPSEVATAATGSSHVAVSTAVGMVLGILCLFTIVVSYQFIPRKRKPSPQLRALAPPAAKPLPLITRIRTRCTKFFQSIRSKLRGNNPANQEPSRRTHRTMRSLYLTPKGTQERDNVRSKFASTLRLNLNFPTSDFLSPTSSPHTPKRTRFYERLGDEGDESHVRLLKPDIALISPWSPSEDAFWPSKPTPSFRSKGSEPRTPPPLYPPPPVYVNGTPVRAGFGQAGGIPETPTKKGFGSDSVLTSPTLVDEYEEIDIGGAGTKSLIDEIQQVLEYTRDWAKEDEQVSSFVIADDDEADNEGGSIYSEPI